MRTLRVIADMKTPRLLDPLEKLHARLAVFAADVHHPSAVTLMGQAQPTIAPLGGRLSLTTKSALTGHVLMMIAASTPSRAIPTHVVRGPSTRTADLQLCALIGRVLMKFAAIAHALTVTGKAQLMIVVGGPPICLEYRALA